jgi:hypothetical protein
MTRMSACKSLCALLFLLLSSVSLQARMERMPSLSRAFEQADAVVEVRIDDKKKLKADLGGQVCANRYKATILNSFKGSFASKQIVFGRYNALDPDRIYLIFLKFETKPEQEYEEVKRESNLADITDKTEKKKIFDLIKCNGTVPGFIYNTRLVWQIVSGYIIINGLLPEDIPDSIRYTSDRSQHWMNKLDLFSYFRSLRKKLH